MHPEVNYIIQYLESQKTSHAHAIPYYAQNSKVPIIQWSSPSSRKLDTSHPAGASWPLSLISVCVTKSWLLPPNKARPWNRTISMAPETQMTVPPTFAWPQLYPNSPSLNCMNKFIMKWNKFISFVCLFVCLLAYLEPFLSCGVSNN